MNKKYVAAAFILLCTILISCSKKHQPQTATEAIKTDKLTEKKIIIRKIKTPVPKLLVMDDKGASHTVDGKLYHDLEGHRYWKNYTDGKYYLYNKSMYADSAFIPH